ncbi:glycosyl hydrolase [Lewinella sp. 4G2]|uniref:WD40/YVTN/BNR-like repeat-containing protein n=1 Tax=Lewinella sp. 4G2 TaxID=1803372 RepID=UPI0007B463CD|nr:glycosyl hydrolase [Lewinella sp. 4G2]OAV44690.1 glycosyl hydrolase [Lewinella sp. 4G2]
MRTFFFSLLLVLLHCTCVSAQSPTVAAVRDQGYQQRLFLQQNSPAAGLKFENIGPSIMSGRVTDVAVDPADPRHFYVAYASGGLWETKDDGITFEPLFDDLPVMTIGAIDVHWITKTIYVGTGEVNSSRSSYAGNGVYRSTDGGNSWTHVGLPESHHIGRVIVDQRDVSTVWVAAMGHLYSDNPERGVFKTTNGGGTWTKTLFVNDSTGVVDLIRDPRNPQELYAASWERSRKAWNFKESGKGSGVYHSTDGGTNWSQISNRSGGFPLGEGAGRIGLSISYDTNGDRYLYASIDNYFRRDAEPRDTLDKTLTKDLLRSMPQADFRRLQTYQLDDFLKGNGFPADLDAATLLADTTDEAISPLDLVEYLEDANSLLFDTPVKGFELYVSKTNGEKWERTHAEFIDGLYNSYGYYFGVIRTLPDDPMTVYALGVPIIKSTDGGATWAGINGDNVHADHHALWINPERPDHLINGNDGGINISYDGGKNWRKANNPPLGQFYSIAVDDHPDGYRVYGGLQDNGTWRGPNNYSASPGWMQRGEYPYKMLFGGDGMQVEVDPRDNNTAYLGYQYGNYYRMDMAADTSTYITPKHKLGERPYRWNWQSPILLSPHDPDVVYMGSNRFHRSSDRGANWAITSEDLTQGGKPGDVAYATLTSISESPITKGLLYVGSDDGLIHRSDDGGETWTNINNGLPRNLWVSRIAAGKHDASTVYLTLNGYRNDDFTSHVYRSTDQGASWDRIGQFLPTEPANVILEDYSSPNLLFVGSDHALYVSIDGGKKFNTVNNGLPAVAVHDLVIHEPSGDLIVGTHGRSLYKANVKLLQAAARESGAMAIDAPEVVRYSSRYGTLDFDLQTRKPEMKFAVYNPGAAAGAELRIKSDDGTTLYQRDLKLMPGINQFTYDQTFDGRFAEMVSVALTNIQEDSSRPAAKVEAAKDGNFYLRKGNYTLTVAAGSNVVEHSFEVK